MGRAAALFLAALFVLVAAIAWWWMHPPDPVAELRARSGALAHLERVPAPELGRGVERWRMITARGDTATALWKPPGPHAGRAAWSIVILGGLGTDDRAALLVPDALPVGVLAVSWPWKGPRRMGRSEFVTSVPKMREALLRTPAVLALGVEAVRRAGPGTRVALLGASLGVPPTVAALALTAPDALMLVHGAADLERLLYAELVRASGGSTAINVLAPPAAALAARLLSSIEPSRHAAPSGTPVLLVDAADDERYPRTCVERLHATFPRATVVTHAGGHLRPRNREAITAIVGEVWRWVETLPESSAR